MPYPDTNSDHSDPYQLLLKTFDRSSDTNLLSPSVIAFARIYQAIDEGDLTVNGLPPDCRYGLGEYLIHGGRVRFDLSSLNSTERNQFADYILNTAEEKTHYLSRRYATHRRGNKDAAGNISEIKSGLWGMFQDTWVLIKDFFTSGNSSKHFGINLPIGGEGRNEPDNGRIAADGKWGHIYIYDDHANAFMMFGVENCLPGKINLRTKKTHSRVGSSNNVSPFLAKKLLDMNDQQNAEQCCLTTKSNNWACVKITPEHLTKMLADPLKLTNETEISQFKARLQTSPKKAQIVEKIDERKKQMDIFQKATMAKNSHSHIWKFAGGFFLTVVGVALSLSPFPPGIAQAIGSTLASIGIKTTIGILMTMTVPAILGYAASLTDQYRKDSAEKSWNEVNKNFSDKCLFSDNPPINPDDVKLKTPMSSRLVICNGLNMELDKQHKIPDPEIVESDPVSKQSEVFKTEVRIHQELPRYSFM